MSDDKKQDVAPATEEKKVEDKKEEKQDVAVPAKFEKMVGEIEKMSVLDLSELVGILEDKFGVSAAMPMMAAGAPAAGEAAAAEEKSEFDIELTSCGENKIAVIKVVKEITGLGLKDAKDKVDGAPVVLKEAVKKEEAEEIKKKIEDAGGAVNLK